ncbi:MAG TPA: carboxymuconolactone decarboxylase family protein [Candidatus Baltobacteraceae bacterium]|nr:carboxymuconolactone decarboxylase family protein [Candidatus Baltobacteraceae bacterium]
MARGDLQASLVQRPQIAQSLTDHLRAVIDGGSVAQVTKHLTAAMTAAVNFCDPLLVQHRRAARELGVSIEKLNALWDFARSDLFTASERAALSAAVALSREPRALPPAVWKQLRSHFDEGGAMEVLCTIGALNYLCRVTNALDSEVPA